MRKRRDARGWGRTLAAALLTGGLGLWAVGCNAGSGGLSAAAQGEAMAAAAIQGGAIPSLLAIQQALHKVDSGAFAALTASSTCGTASTTGSAAAGTVDLTFPGGAGCSSPYGALDNGTFGSAYSASGNSVSVTTTFASTFKVTAVRNDEQTVSGALTTDLTVSTTAKTATGPLNGTITHTAQGQARTLLFALTEVVLDSSTATPTAKLNGRVTIDDPQLGTWKVDLSDVVIGFDGCFKSGTATTTRLDIIKFEFTDCSGGDIKLGSLKIGTFSW